MLPIPRGGDGGGGGIANGPLPPPPLPLPRLPRPPLNLLKRLPRLFRLWSASFPGSISAGEWSTMGAGTADWIDPSRGGPEGLGILVVKLPLGETPCCGGSGSGGGIALGPALLTLVTAACGASLAGVFTWRMPGRLRSPVSCINCRARISSSCSCRNLASRS